MNVVKRLLTAVLLCAAAPLFAQQGTVSGRLNYTQKIALPPEAQAHIILTDVTRGDASGIMVAEKKFAVTQQIPIPFSLAYDKAKIDPSHKYAVSARISISGRLRFVSAKKSAVLTQGKGANVDLMLRPVSSGGGK